MDRFLPNDLADVHALFARPLNPSAFPETQAFETALTDMFGVKEAVAVSSGTSALHSALVALGIGPGDEVLVPALSVIMSAVPILYQGAHPVFVDSEPCRVDFDYDDLERKLSPRTKAIMPVSLWGCSYNMDRLLHVAKQHHLAVIEDTCQAHGSQWQGRYLGTWGDVGCFSLRDGKLMSTGEGGFLLTNNHELAEKCRAFRSHWVHGFNPAHSYQQLGHNYRLPELLALLGRKQLSHLDTLLAHRRWQTAYVLAGVADVCQVESYRYAAQETPNMFGPLLLLRAQFATRRVAQQLARRGVINSVGSFGLKPAQEWGVFQQAPSETPLFSATPNATAFLSRALAISLLPHYAEAELEHITKTIKQTVEEMTHGSNAKTII